MLTLKFGGTSMGNAQRIIEAANIAEGRAQDDRISVVVSAVAGVSNGLQSAIDSCAKGESAHSFVRGIRKEHERICEQLASLVPGFDCRSVLLRMEGEFVELERLLSGVGVFGECTQSIHCRIMGTGELLSVQIFSAVLRAKKQDVLILDSRSFIFTTGSQIEGEADYVKTSRALSPFKDGGEQSQSRVLLFPGFICSWRERPTDESSKPLPGLLGRNGSDFSAAIVAYALDARRVEFWTDVDGICTADPRIVKDAILVDDMTYEEAMELSFFGSKVLHPKTLAPLAAKGIEAWTLNSLNPESRGTRIGKSLSENAGKESAEKSESTQAGETASEVSPVRGISSRKRTALISVSGSGMKGKAGTASRVFAAVSRAGVSTLLITQSSSEYTISFCVRQREALTVKDALSSEFALEIKSGVIDPIDVIENTAIVSIVGDGMRKNRGVAGKFFDSLASCGVNILAIAQGSSERSISTVINGEEGDLAVQAAHRFFFNTTQTIEVFVFGAGTIGGTLIDQIRDQREVLLSQKVDVKVMAIASLDGMIIDDSEGAKGLDLSDWRNDVIKSGEAGNAADLDKIISFVKRNKPLNPIFVDCTASYDLPERYISIFEAGMNIATPNKRANSMRMSYYKALRRAANKMRKRFLYETNVGAGLPIIDTLQNLFKSGDCLKGFYGIMSGSLSFIFGELDKGVSFSQAVKTARDLRFTEPDPRDDLQGTDVARKALIIAREAGMNIELEDIKMNSIFPDGFSLEGTVDDFMSRISELDSYFAEKTASLKAQGKVLRMGASIVSGNVSVGLLEVGAENPLYGVTGGENAFVFHTERYSPIPLTVRGYGAGAQVTAAGVFGDILRTVSFNPRT